MSRFGTRLGVAGMLGLLLGLSGCAQQFIPQRENMLAAAGFQVEPADTPARMEQLQTLPPRKLVLTQREGKPTWLYADPHICHCLYVGGPSQYQHYAQLRYQSRIARQNEETAQLNSWNWGWGPWGGPWGPWGPWEF